MAIDLRQFHQTFFDESLEGLSEMESELLKIEAGMAGERAGDTFEADHEALNTIFRVAHSIKGGAATFGFSAVADFAHAAETVLDELREGRVAKNRQVLTALLRSVDCLRSLLAAARDGAALDMGELESVRQALEAAHAGKDAKDRRTKKKATEWSIGREFSGLGWRISFRPHADLFLTGNDPLRILRELARLGNMKVIVDTSGLPQWETLDPGACYLSWAIELEGNATRETISEVFAWVEGDCDLQVAPLNHAEVANPTAGELSAAFPAQHSIRVSLPKIDALVDQVGELVITQTMLGRFEQEFDVRDLEKLRLGLVQLERNVRDLQESVMRIRMLPIGFAFNRLPRIVRDLSHQLDKKVHLRITGEQTELDKTVIERISDPLMHLVRNCLDHGIESPAERRVAGKNETATLRVDAYQRGGNVFVEIEDDGRGLQRDRIMAKAIERALVPFGARLTNEQIDELIFLPGFSTAETVSDISGRGVGLDVVRSNLNLLGGSVEVSSQPGAGARFTLRLPLTLAMMEGLIVKVGDQSYIIPLLSVLESLSIPTQQVGRPAGGGEVFPYQGGYLPLVRLHELFGLTPLSVDVGQGIVVVVDVGGKLCGIFVDQLLGQQQVVVKSLETHYRKVDGIATATILGDGEVVLVLDLASLIRSAHARSQAA